MTSPGRPAGQAAAQVQPARVLWRQGNPHGPADADLADLGTHWSIRILAGAGRGSWLIRDSPITVADLLAYLPVAPEAADATRMYQPVPARLTVVATVTVARRPVTFATCQPFPSASHATLHPRCAEALAAAKANTAAARRAAASAGAPIPANWTPTDPGLWLATTVLPLAETATAVAHTRSIPVEFAGLALSAAGFARLSPAAAEIAAGLAAEWERPLPELVDTAELLG